MNKFTINLKRLGKKKIYKTEVDIEQQPKNLKMLLTACVKQQVNTFNKKRESIILLNFLSPSAIQEQSETGKIGFGDIDNKNLADIDKSIENVLIGFENGLFLVFINNNEITSLNQEINLKPKDEISIIRMTFLTGTYW
ncbi:hypothetical protein EGM88_10100 [Aureibaculum marinum]|uniref:Uncharacterized protein n=1 Tax=Aureibaculum marinum TaxID=2487930 RepID=A0A3N4NJV8_9FLAO|nr:hypothetical protein [Aureibaculum marinum]RPD96702.1 hypothetical protein EGM88_10100 [Aureibaculum marinum]